MVAGSEANICDGCIERAAAVVAEHRASNPPSSSVRLISEKEPDFQWPGFLLVASPSWFRNAIYYRNELEGGNHGATTHRQSGMSNAERQRRYRQQLPTPATRYLTP